jgi:hypothetical protein
MKYCQGYLAGGGSKVRTTKLLTKVERFVLHRLPNMNCFEGDLNGKHQFLMIQYHPYAVLRMFGKLVPNAILCCKYHRLAAGYHNGMLVLRYKTTFITL